MAKPKKIRLFNSWTTISLTYLIPVICAGAAVLSLQVADMTSPDLFQLRQLLPLSTLVASSVFTASLIGMYLIRRPFARFIKSSSCLKSDSLSHSHRNVIHKFDALDSFFEKVLEALSSAEEHSLFPRMLGKSRNMLIVFSQLIKVAPTETTVLLLGESGTGKELAALSIHEKSNRAKEPFVAVNCAAIPEGLLESELFGHEKGSFTGASAIKIGKFEQAGSGTLFLDEIGDMSLSTQSKILRVLEMRSLERLGGSRCIPIKARIIAATHRSLIKMIDSGEFRKDLYYRINVFPIQIPPLRERREDIGLIAQNIIENIKPGSTLSSAALIRLKEYTWPGNVRELRNVIERAIVFSDNNTIETKHIIISEESNTITHSEICKSNNLDARLDEFEISIIKETLRITGGVQSKAAMILGIQPRSLKHRVKKFKIVASEYRRTD